MKRYEPAAEVLPEYSDERVRDGCSYGPALAEMLSQVPAEFRQPLMAESHQRAYRIDIRWPYGRNAMAELESVPVRDLDEVRAEVLAEILEQLRRDGGAA